MATLGLGRQIAAQRQIYGLLDHVGGLIAGEQPEIDAGMLAMKVGQPGQQPVAGEAGGGVEHQLVWLAVLLQPLDPYRQLQQHILGGGQQILACISEGDRAPLAMKQWLAEQLLQGADLLADGGLGEVQLLRRLMKTAEPGRRLEAPQHIEWGPVFEHH
ncbi:hypothetical protein D3C84_702450 [compost metagenome]